MSAKWAEARIPRGEAPACTSTGLPCGDGTLFNGPRTLKKREVVSGQYVIDIPLKVAVEGTRRAIADINLRGDQVGHVVRDRFISHYEPVLAGTRIPVAAIKRFLSPPLDGGGGI